MIFLLFQTARISDKILHTATPFRKGKNPATINRYVFLLVYVFLLSQQAMAVPEQPELSDEHAVRLLYGRAGAIRLPVHNATFPR